MRFHTLLLGCFCISASTVTLPSGLRGQDDTAPTWYRMLLRTTKSVAESREARMLKAHVREEAWQRWEDCSPCYGLKLLDTLEERKRVVVFVHGYNSRPEALSRLIAWIRDQGLAAAIFRYPNDEPLEESADRLAVALRELEGDYPHTEIFLLTHSMGGLVARRVVEDPDRCPRRVSRLVMMAPPNQGSALTRGAKAMDVVEYAWSSARRGESGMFSGSVLDGLAEARLDLQPNSDFLRALNARPRNPDVDYTIVAGTGGPLRPGALTLAQAWLDRGAVKSDYARIAFEELEVRVDDLDELVRGRGDGAVSLASTRLEGVDDVIEGDISHWDLLLPGPTAEVRRVRTEILKRLVAG